MSGMTLKQYARWNFFDLLNKYREARKHLDTKEGRLDFIALSIQIHAAKAGVPKRLWPLVNKYE